ncbi:conserved exported hypothetical protein [Candidatus Sulfopaludibacter sp. SbA3]|nr:conserved exported hypothetical protein [Candidatus Sulfopaludibacter sp. SbA3]
MKKLLLLGAILVFVLQAYNSPLATIVLNSASLSTGKLPSDWKITVNHGRPEVSVCSDSEGPCLHLKSVKSSFALERAVDVSPSETPFLTWRWKVTQLPAHGDFRRASTDDQAAQVLVAFADRKILSYIWDSSAPKGTAESASNIPMVHVFAVVCESGVSVANRWLSENRNVAADYERAYGKPAPRVKGLRIQINSQHTGSVAESYFGDVAFRSSPQ